MNRMLDKKVNGRFPFQYTHSTATDVTKTWAKAIKKQQEKPKAEVRSLPQRVISKS